jgi:hypothetical protein
MMLVTLDDAKERLRIVHNAEDVDLEMMIEQASAAVMNYLGRPLDYYDQAASSESDADTVTVAPAEVKLATLLLVGILARDRDGVESKDWGHGYLPRPVMAFLYPLRDPVMG